MNHRFLGAACAMLLSAALLSAQSAPEFRPAVGFQPPTAPQGWWMPRPAWPMQAPVPPSAPIRQVSAPARAMPKVEEASTEPEAEMTLPEADEIAGGPAVVSESTGACGPACKDKKGKARKDKACKDKVCDPKADPSKFTWKWNKNKPETESCGPVAEKPIKSKFSWKWSGKKSEAESEVCAPVEEKPRKPFEWTKNRILDAKAEQDKQPRPVSDKIEVERKLFRLTIKDLREKRIANAEPMEQPQTVHPHVEREYTGFPRYEVTDTPSGCDDNPCFWMAFDFLGWNVKEGRIPVPLAFSDTGLVLGNSPLDYDLQIGGRIRTGFRLFDTVCLEASAFVLSEREAEGILRSDANGAPPIGRPVFDVATRTGQILAVSTPLDPVAGTVQTGQVSFESSSKLWGMELNAAPALVALDTLVVKMLGGVRYLSLNEDLHVLQTSTATSPLGTTTFQARDAFEADSRFFGGQLGLQTSSQMGRCFLSLTGKVALGGTVQTVDLSGSTASTTAGVTTTGPGILTSRPGRRTDNDFTFVPQFTAELGWQLAPHVCLSGGYDYLFWNRVSRVGDQVSNLLNVPGTVPGVNSSTFWAQGFSASLAVRY